MNDEIIEITRGHILARVACKVYRLEGEGLTGDDRLVDFVLFSNSLRTMDEALDTLKPNVESVIQTISMLLTKRGLRISIE